MDFLQTLSQWHVVSFFVQCFISLFVVVNPIGNVPIFVALLGKGKTVTKVAVRIMGLMLLSLAMQFIVTGILGAFDLR